jgi:hypothetical protein
MYYDVFTNAQVNGDHGARFRDDLWRVNNIANPRIPMYITNTNKQQQRRVVHVHMCATFKTPHTAHSVNLAFELENDADTKDVLMNVTSSSPPQLHHFTNTSIGDVDVQLSYTYLHLGLATFTQQLHMFSKCNIMFTTPGGAMHNTALLPNGAVVVALPSCVCGRKRRLSCSPYANQDTLDALPYIHVIHAGWHKGDVSDDTKSTGVCGYAQRLPQSSRRHCYAGYHYHKSCTRIHVDMAVTSLLNSEFIHDTIEIHDETTTTTTATTA